MKSDLVVDDYVNRAADRVARQLAHVECFLHDAFSCKGGVAVEQNAKAMPSLSVAFPVLPGSQAADGDGIDKFEVARIETQGKPETLALGTRPSRLVAEMVFHVPPSFVMHVIRIGELTEDLLGVLADDIGEDVEAAAVRHAHDDIVDSLLASSFEQQVE